MQYFLKLYKRIILKFIWGDKPHKIAYEKLIQNTDKLGVKLVDLSMKNLAFKAAWPARLESKQQDSIKWFYNTFPIKDNRIWNCNISIKDINKIPDMSNYARSIWLAWSQFNYAPQRDTQEEILTFRVWGNSLISRENKPIFDKKLVRSGIDTILDMYDPNTGKITTYEKIQEQFDIPYLMYISLRAAIPNIWKNEIQRSSMDEVLDVETKLQFIMKAPTPSKLFIAN